MKPVAQQVVEWALGEGALLAGLADPRQPVSHAAHVRGWAERGREGPMDWWPRHLELRLDPLQLLPSARSLLMVAVAYSGDVPELEGATAKVSRYALGRDYHKVLRSLLKRFHARLEQECGQAVEARICVDTAPLLERYWAWQAGLGWIGKNCMLINPRYGSWLLLGGILLDLELEPDEPHPEYCGRCVACLDECPTGAFTGPGCLDSRRCISCQTIENRGGDFPDDVEGLPGNWLFGCDICQEVCPWNRKALPAAHPELEAHPEMRAELQRGEWPAGTDFWDRITRGRALRRMHHGMYLRNRSAVGLPEALPGPIDRDRS